MQCCRFLGVAFQEVQKLPFKSLALVCNLTLRMKRPDRFMTKFPKLRRPANGRATPQGDYNVR